MCGIAGLFQHQPPERDALAERVRAMTASLAHRGPDGEGEYFSPKGRLALGHRRLAILDLNPTGDQPMVDATGRYAFIFNGEVYNYRALREDLLSRGVTLRSTGDAEAVFQFLIREGPACLAKFRGMFALAFWDEHEQSLLVARDRFGIKPLVYAESPEGVAFGSEIRALAAGGWISDELDPAAFLYYLQWGSIAPPLTWKRDAKALCPGHWRRYRPGRAVESGCFADVRELFITRPGADLSESELRARTGAAVEESVRLHLESDVPVGVFLSGGIDSSSLVSAVSTVTGSRVQTYTITFDEAAFSEEPIAADVARHFGTDHHTLRVTARLIQDDLPHIIEHLDQPSNDGINSYYVSRAVAQTGLKVVLSGTGGDELFGGYPSFQWLPNVNARRHMLRWLGPLLQGFQKPHRREKWRHLVRHASDWAESYRAVRGLFLPHELPFILGERVQGQLKGLQAEVQKIEREVLSPTGTERPAASVARLESRQYLGVQLLRDIDAMAMAHALEVRVPLVDAELAATLWPGLGSQPALLANKRLLYETLRRPLPPSVFNRPKQGFTFPFAQWLRRELREFVEAGQRHLVDQGWLDRHLPDRLRDGFEAGTVHWSRLWSLGVFGQMCLRHKHPRHPSTPSIPEPAVFST
jgi:asparagine synthase (glutamine-hydrolysing)